MKIDIKNKIKGTLIMVGIAAICVLIDNTRIFALPRMLYWMAGSIGAAFFARFWFKDILDNK